MARASEEENVIARVLNEQPTRPRSAAEWRRLSNAVLRWRHRPKTHAALADRYYLPLQYARAMAEGGEQLVRFGFDMPQFLAWRRAVGRPDESVTKPSDAEMQRLAERLQAYEGECMRSAWRVGDAVASVQFGFERGLVCMRDDVPRTDEEEAAFTRQLEPLLEAALDEDHVTDEEFGQRLDQAMGHPS